MVGVADVQHVIHAIQVHFDRRGNDWQNFLEAWNVGYAVLFVDDVQVVFLEEL